METHTDARHAFSSPSGYLEWDIERLQGRLEAVAGQVDAGRLAEARRAFGSFERGFARHLRIEEELIYPVFDARAGIVGGPTATLCQEHAVLREALCRMGRALDARDAPGFREGLAFFETTLAPHRSKEERLLFPVMEALLTERERQVFAERVQRE